jgi:hypothetical protein
MSLTKRKRESEPGYDDVLLYEASELVEYLLNYHGLKEELFPEGFGDLVTGHVFVNSGYDSKFPTFVQRDCKPMVAARLVSIVSNLRQRKDVEKVARTGSE